jgi:hypothetical protein
LLFRDVATTQLNTVDMHVVFTVTIAKLVVLAIAASVGYLKYLRDPDNLVSASAAMIHKMTSCLASSQFTDDSGHMWTLRHELQ